MAVYGDRIVKYAIISGPDGEALYLNLASGNSERIGPRPYGIDQLRAAIKRLADRERR